MPAILNDSVFGKWIWAAVGVAFLWNLFPSLLFSRRLLVRFASSETPQILKGWLMLSLLVLTVWVAVARGWWAGLCTLALWLVAGCFGITLSQVIRPFALRRLRIEDLEAIQAARERDQI